MTGSGKDKMTEEINLEEVKEYFSQKGYEPIKLEQIWRHVTGTLKKDDQKYFLKLASTQEISIKTENEYKWNELTKSLTKNLPVSIPQNYEKGKFEGLFWFATEFIDGKILADPKDKKNTQDLEKHLPIIVNTAANIINIKTNKKLPLDEKTSEDGKQKFFNKLRYWADQTPEDLRDMINFIKQRYDNKQIAPCHGDFVPWHFIVNRNGKLYLLDGEHAHILGLKFYDVAYFYHRVYTKLGRPDIADKFLGRFKDIYKLSLEDKEHFRFVLAQRIIGGYYDAERDNITNKDLQKGLKTKLLSGEVIN